MDVRRIVWIGLISLLLAGVGYVSFVPQVDGVRAQEEACTDPTRTACQNRDELIIGTDDVAGEARSSGEALWAELGLRTEAWVRLVQAEDMNEGEVVRAINGLRWRITELTGSGEPDWWLAGAELNLRLEELCGRLPGGHVYRGGEFCD